MAAVFVEFKYVSDTRSGTTGHRVYAISPGHLDEILDRHYITKERLKWARVDGDEIAAEFLREYVYHIFKLQKEKGGTTK